MGTSIRNVRNLVPLFKSWYNLFQGRFFFNVSERELELLLRNSHDLSSSVSSWELLKRTHFLLPSRFLFSFVAHFYYARVLLNQIQKIFALNAWKHYFCVLLLLATFLLTNFFLQNKNQLCFTLHAVLQIWIFQRGTFKIRYYSRTWN